MRRSLPLCSLLAFSVALPAAGQDGNINFGAFITVEATEIEAFEREVRSHNQWHGEQGDTWTWVTYQSMTGPLEYAVITANHRWADFDTPVVDMAADMAHWNRSGARHTASEVFRIWQSLPELSNVPSDAMAFPVVQVIEWEIRPGGNEEAIWHTVGKYKEAVGDQGTFGWARTVSDNRPPRFWVAVWHPNFAALDTPAPDPMTIMTQALGRAEAQAAADLFTANAAAVSSRMWMLRPDLSYVPAGN